MRAISTNFDAKIKFGYLQPEQAWQLFKAYLDNHGNTEALNPAYSTAKLATLTTLELGDFAVADKQACWRTDEYHA